MRQREVAGDRDERARILVRTWQRDRAEQPLRIGVPHPVEHVVDVAGMHPVELVEDAFEVVVGQRQDGVPGQHRGSRFTGRNPVSYV